MSYVMCKNSADKENKLKQEHRGTLTVHQQNIHILQKFEIRK